MNRWTEKLKPRPWQRCWSGRERCNLPGPSIAFPEHLERREKRQKKVPEIRSASIGPPPWRCCPRLPGPLLLPVCSHLNQKEESGLHKSTSQPTGLQRLAPTFVRWRLPGLSALRQQEVLFYHQGGPGTLGIRWKEGIWGVKDVLYPWVSR